MKSLQEFIELEYGLKQWKAFIENCKPENQCYTVPSDKVLSSYTPYTLEVRAKGYNETTDYYESIEILETLEPERWIAKAFYWRGSVLNNFDKIEKMHYKWERLVLDNPETKFTIFKETV